MIKVFIEALPKQTIGLLELFSEDWLKVEDTTIKEEVFPHIINTKLLKYEEEY